MASNGLVGGTHLKPYTLTACGFAPAQVTDAFLDGHGNDDLEVLGRGEVLCES